VSFIQPFASMRVIAGPPINHVSTLASSGRTSIVNIGCGLVHSICFTVPFTVTSLSIATGHEWWAASGRNGGCQHQDDRGGHEENLHGSWPSQCSERRNAMTSAASCGVMWKTWHRGSKLAAIAADGTLGQQPQRRLVVVADRATRLRGARVAQSFGQGGAKGMLPRGTARVE
jgi:hypothetical protein